jgi:hypothetical protein
MIKVVKDLLSIYMKNQDFFYNGEHLCLKNKSDLLCAKNLSKIFQYR